MDKEEIKEYVFKNGKSYEPKVLPSEIPMMKIGHCFDNCVLLLATSELKNKYKYVEGFAKNPISKQWHAHAWLTDLEGKYAFDPTWKAFNKLFELTAVPTEYIGVELPIIEVMLFMLETRNAGCLVNAWRNDEWYKRAKELNFIS